MLQINYFTKVNKIVLTKTKKKKVKKIMKINTLLNVKMITWSIGFGHSQHLKSSDWKPLIKLTDINGILLKCSEVFHSILVK